MARAKRRTHNHSNNDQSELDNEMENGEENGEGMEHAAHEMGGMARRQFRRMQHNPFNPFEVFGEPMARLMDQNWSIFQRMMHVMREESLHFVNRRLEQTSHAIESSKDCDGISDLMAVQQEWVVNFARDYAEQTKRIAEMVRDLAEDGTSNLSHAASEVGERGRHAAEEEARHAA